MLTHPGIATSSHTIHAKNQTPRISRAEKIGRSGHEKFTPNAPPAGRSWPAKRATKARRRAAPLAL